MDIQKTTANIMLKAIANFSKEYEVAETETQLMIKASDEDCAPIYKVLVNNKVKKQVSFNQILNVKLDFLGREIIATPFIASSLRKLRREQGCGFEELSILIYKKTEEEQERCEEEQKNIPNLYFFEGVKPIKSITFDYLFGDMN
jgi:hypothetical protein